MSVIERKLKFVEKLHIVLQWGYTFVFVNISWLIFRSESLSQVKEIIKGILRLDFSGYSYSALTAMLPTEILSLASSMQFGVGAAIIFLVVLLISVLQLKNTDEKIEDFKPTCFKAFITIILMSWCILSFGSKIIFLYEMF
ncbi:MAG: hypothetical protein U0L05_01095 [Schaedlerella sp.]|nr:hypothetical protein [Schaedlerella sp.]